LILIIGGAAQGKLAYALSAFGLTRNDAACGFLDAEKKAIFDGLHQAVRAALAAGEDPQAAMEQVLAVNPSLIVICDEIGCGVVPLLPEQREWREAVGRLCCTLASRADQVIRVFCGLPMILKGE
jgi:adenosylcobinamide kinase/adenosylcobinamide-phosphate guanylyltransferase